MARFRVKVGPGDKVSVMAIYTAYKGGPRKVKEFVGTKAQARETALNAAEHVARLRLGASLAGATTGEQETGG